jgi:hypothetical protein
MSRAALVRVGALLTVGGLAAAVALAVLLIVFANADAGQPISTELSPARIFWMSLAFCLFTLPIGWVVGFPTYWLARRFNLLRGWVGGLAGGAVGVAAPYAFRLVRAQVQLDWPAMLWLGLGGVLAGWTVALLARARALRHD